MRNLLLAEFDGLMESIRVGGAARDIPPPSPAEFDAMKSFFMAGMPPR